MVSRTLCEMARSHPRSAVKIVCWLLLLPVVVTCNSTPPQSKQNVPVRTQVVIQPLGEVEESLLQTTKLAIESKINVTARISKPVPLPASAYYPPRRRYRADQILNFLNGQKSRVGDKILAVTMVDVSTAKPPHADWGVFGLGILGGKSCVVSTYRLNKPGPKTLRERVAEVALHEVGHTFGLEHCPTPGCLMNDAEGSIKSIDSSSGDFCPTCLHRIK